MSDFQEFETKSKATNYKKWAYKLFIYMFFTNILVAYMTIQGNYQIWAVLICSALASVLMIIGSFLTLLSILNKEEKNYQYHISLWGYLIFIILTIVSMFS